MIRLLLVEDDNNLSYIVQTGLQDIIGGYEVITACNGKEGLEAWKEHHPDIIISDIDMPVMNGFEMVRLIRETDGDTPILFASALTSPKDVRKGYDIGVNNYVKKPFIPDELDAHLHAILKMKEGARSRNESSMCKFGNYTLDAGHATLRNTATGQSTTLTAREAQILQLLAGNKGEVVRREVILSRCWEKTDDYFASRSLDVFINKLRKLFENDPQIEIKTVRGVGLALVFLISCIMTPDVHAQAESMIIALSARSVKIGDTLAVTVTLPAGVTGTVNLTYSKDLFTYQSATAETSVNAGTVSMTLGSYGSGNKRASGTVKFKADAAGTASF